MGVGNEWMKQLISRVNAGKSARHAFMGLFEFSTIFYGSTRYPGAPGAMPATT
jgi:hypothetical protein